MGLKLNESPTQKAGITGIHSNDALVASFSYKKYLKQHTESVKNPKDYWGEIAKTFFWDKDFTQVYQNSYSKDYFDTWFKDGTTNICYNCLDRHLDKHKNKPAFIYIPNDGEPVKITYQKLYYEVCNFANGLKKLGLHKGDRVIICMPLIPEAAIAMLACSRIGLVHQVVSGDFSATNIKNQILKGEARVVVTSNQLLKGGKIIELKKAVDEAMDLSSSQASHVVNHCVVFLRTDAECEMLEDRDIFWHDFTIQEPPVCSVQWLSANEPLFLLQDHQSKKDVDFVLHSTGGYMVCAGATYRQYFDVCKDDVFFCLADLGWIEAHTYMIYGSLLNGTTSVIYEEPPQYCSNEHLKNIIKKESVTVFCSRPKNTARDFLNKYNEILDGSLIRLTAFINQGFQQGDFDFIKKLTARQKIPSINLWIKAMTGSAIFFQFLFNDPQNTASGFIPFFGINPKVLTDTGVEFSEGEAGWFAFETCWPGMMQTNDFFFRFDGYLCTGEKIKKLSDETFHILTLS